MTTSGAAGVLGFLVRRSAANTVRRTLQRVRQPRYAVAMVVGLVYFSGTLLPSFFRGGKSGDGSTLATEVGPGLLAASAAILALLAAAAWILRGATTALPLGEADVHFLFPAPLTRSAILHYAILRPQLALAGSALVMTILRRGGSEGALRSLLGWWIVLAIAHLHAQALGFWKASIDARAVPARLAMRIATAAVPALVAAAVLAAAWQGIEDLSGALESARHGLQALGRVAEPLGRGLAGALLTPFRWVLAPLLAPTGAAFLASLPAAAAIAALHYVAVLRLAGSFEDATLAEATRRATVREARRAGRLAPASEKRRHVVPFALHARGIPELALTWKNLMMFRRVRVRSYWLAVAASCVAVATAAAALVPGEPVYEAAARVFVLTVAALSTQIGIWLPMTLRNDLRADLAEAATLRTWPLRPRRLIAAELAAPLVLAISYAWSGLALALSAYAGVNLGCATRGIPATPWLPQELATWGGGREGLILTLGTLAVAFTLPAIAAIVLVLQNAATLAFPGWFKPGSSAGRGIEATGAYALGFLATIAVLLVACLPSLLFSGVTILLLGPLLGALSLPLAAFSAALPLAVLTWMGVTFLARLWERFDLAADL